MTDKEDIAEDPSVTAGQEQATFNGTTGEATSASLMAKTPRFVTSIIDPKEQGRREKRLKIKKQRAKGRRGQPPMTDRLRAVAICVDYLERQGVRFGTARNSRMNKEIRKWLNERMRDTDDDRKSRRGTISSDAVSDLLKQVAELRK